MLKLHESIETSDRIYLVMEYLRGKSLAKVLAEDSGPEHKLSAAQSLRILKQLCLALSLLSDEGISHRDIKLENIIFDPDSSRVTLIDFGFAVQSFLPLTKQCGSLMFMAPELFTGQPFNGHLSDVWAVGVVFYAMTTGHFPFAAYTERDIISKIKRAIYAVDEGYPFQSLLQKMMVADPNLRSKGVDLLK